MTPAQQACWPSLGPSLPGRPRTLRYAVQLCSLAAASPQLASAAHYVLVGRKQGSLAMVLWPDLASLLLDSQTVLCPTWHSDP